MVVPCLSHFDKYLTSDSLHIEISCFLLSPPSVTAFFPMPIDWPSFYMVSLYVWLVPSTSNTNRSTNSLIFVSIFLSAKPCIADTFFINVKPTTIQHGQMLSFSIRDTKPSTVHILTMLLVSEDGFESMWVGNVTALGQKELNGNFTVPNCPSG